MKTLSKHETTLGICSAGNMRALTMALFSVLNSRTVPHKILIRLEGDLPGIDDFYFAQALEMARIAGVEALVTVGTSKGVRAARDWLLNNCSTEWLWMLDDDVIADPDCLVNLCRSRITESVAAIQGVKSDLNNRRGYANFFKGASPLSLFKEGASPNHRWQQLAADLSPNTAFPTVKIHTIDTGNVFINMAKVNEKCIRFSMFPDSVNSGGEDTLFALMCYHKGMEVAFNAWAVSYHLEKPNIRFDEFSARCEMVSRAMDALGMSSELKEKMRHELMSWAWQRDELGNIKNFAQATCHEKTNENRNAGENGENSSDER